MTRDEALQELKDSRAKHRLAHLCGADLRGADLRNAYLRGADLTGANLRNAILTDAILTDANLRCADLRNANLRCAELTHANLTDANLTDAILTDANLRCANRTGTCLDPNNKPSGASDKWQKVTTRSGVVWVHGYRTMHSTHIGEQVYAPGYYEAPVFSTSQTECHPGLYLFETAKQARDWAEDAPVVEVITMASEIHEAGNKSRCRWFIAGEEVTT